VGQNLLLLPLSGSELNSFVNSTKFFNVRLGLNYVFKWRDKVKKSDIKNVNPGADDDRGLRRKMYKNYTPDKTRKGINQE
jgi:hypothetical protein